MISNRFFVLGSSLNGAEDKTQKNNERNMKIKRFEDIEAWQLARELTGKTRAKIGAFIKYLLSCNHD